VRFVGTCLKVDGVGSWFQDGLAVYIEKKMSGEKPEGTMRTDMRNGNWQPLVEFFAIPVLLNDPVSHGKHNYAQAGALIDFMINTKVEPVAGRFSAFLDAARSPDGRGRGAAVAAKLIQKVYGLTVPEFEARWREHLGPD
jgi:hypothetical protein